MSAGQKYKVLFMGTPELSVPCLQLLHHHPLIDISCVISMPDRPQGRGQNLQSPPVIQYAKEHKLPFLQTANINNEYEHIQLWKKQKIDFIVVLAFAQFLNEEILNLPNIACFNIHTSVLPKYRGAAPIHYALMNNDSTTGVSIQRMVKKMDAGDLVYSQEIPIRPWDHYLSLSQKLMFLCPQALDNVISSIHHQKLTYIPQDETKISFAPTISKDQGLIRPNEQAAQEVMNLQRALILWPGLYFYLDHNRLKVLELRNSEFTIAAGEIKNRNNQFILGLKDQSLRLSRVQIQGKKACSDQEFLQGFRGELKITESPS